MSLFFQYTDMELVTVSETSLNQLKKELGKRLKIKLIEIELLEKQVIQLTRSTI